VQSTDAIWDKLAKDMCFRDERHMYDVFYGEMQLSVSEIADRLKVGTATLNRRMHLKGVVKRSRGGARKSADKKALLFYLDQRIIMALKNKTIADLWQMSYSLVYNYKRWKAGGSCVGYNLSATGREHTMEDVR